MTTDGELPPPERLRLPCELVIRESVSPRRSDDEGASRRHGVAESLRQPLAGRVGSGRRR
jgi:hypothetical protein